MHPLDISIAEGGGPFRAMTPAPGLLRRVMCRLFFHPEERLEPVAIDQPLTDGGEYCPSMAASTTVVMLSSRLQGRLQ